jgi:hypothetical protein
MGVIMLKYLNKMKKLNIILILFFCFLMVLCQRTNKDAEISYNNHFATDTIHPKENTVLLIYPSDRTINSLKKKLGDDFYIIADDANYYSANIMEYLNSLKVPYFNICDSVKVIIKDSKNQKKEIKNTNNDLYWYVVMYNIKTGNYKISSLVDFENVYKRFYRTL